MLGLCVGCGFAIGGCRELVAVLVWVFLNCLWIGICNNGGLLEGFDMNKSKKREKPWVARYYAIRQRCYNKTKFQDKGRTRRLRKVLWTLYSNGFSNCSWYHPDIDINNALRKIERLYGGK